MEAIFMAIIFGFFVGVVVTIPAVVEYLKKENK